MSGNADVDDRRVVNEYQFLVVIAGSAVAVMCGAFIIALGSVWGTW